jgi:hypothetical protein
MTPRPVETSVAAGALWIRRQNPPPQLAVSALKEKFRLDTVQACEAIALAKGLKIRGASE